MTFLAILVIFSALIIQFIEGNWKGVIILTFFIGFLQDPLRKLTPGQPTWMVGLVLVGFLLTAAAIYADRRGDMNVKAIVWTMPTLGKWLPIYFTLIAFQALNSFARFRSITMSFSGVVFYIAPIFGLWIG